MENKSCLKNDDYSNTIEFFKSKIGLQVCQIKENKKKVKNILKLKMAIVRKLKERRLKKK